MDPTNPCCVAGMAMVLGRDEGAKDALAMLESLGKPQRWRSEVLHAKSVMLHALEKYEEALSAVDEVLRERPFDAQARLTRAQDLSSLGRHLEELAELEHVLELSPGRPDALGMRVVCLLDLGRDAEAEAAFHSADCSYAYQTLQLMLLYAVDENRCAAIIPKLIRFKRLDPENPAASLLLAVAFLGAGESEKGGALLYASLAELRGSGRLNEVERALMSYTNAFHKHRKDGCAGQIIQEMLRIEPDSKTWKAMEAWANTPFVNLRDLGKLIPTLVKPKQESPDEKKERIQKRNTGKLEGAKGSLAAADAGLKALEEEAAGVEALAAELEAKVAMQLPSFVRAHGIISAEDAKSKLEAARNRCNALEEQKAALATKIAACEHAITAYMREHGIDEKDDSVLLGHIRKHTRRGAQRGKLEDSVEQRRQFTSQASVLEGSIADAKAARDSLEIALIPFIGLAGERDRARERLRQLQQQIENEKKESDALKRKITLLEAKAD